jgi:hypothetical protein
VTASFALGYELFKALVAMHEKEQHRSDHLKVVEVPEGHIDGGHGKGSRDDPIALD